jgi:hypothetical protein
MLVRSIVGIGFVNIESLNTLRSYWASYYAAIAQGKLTNESSKSNALRTSGRATSVRTKVFVAEQREPPGEFPSDL